MEMACDNPRCPREGRFIIIDKPGRNGVDFRRRLTIRCAYCYAQEATRWEKALEWVDVIDTNPKEETTCAHYTDV